MQGAGQRRSAAPGATLTLAEYALHDGSNEDRDRYAKRQFHWQRGVQSSHRLEHPAGDNAPAADASGTWVRVAEAIAGANWGGTFVPAWGRRCWWASWAATSTARW